MFGVIAISSSTPCASPNPTTNLRRPYPTSLHLTEHLYHNFWTFEHLIEIKVVNFIARHFLGDCDGVLREDDTAGSAVRPSGSSFNFAMRRTGDLHFSPHQTCNSHSGVSSRILSKHCYICVLFLHYHCVFLHLEIQHSILIFRLWSNMW